jgi:hypothetical protein
MIQEYYRIYTDKNGRLQLEIKLVPDSIANKSMEGYMRWHTVTTKKTDKEGNVTLETQSGYV